MSPDPSAPWVGARTVTREQLGGRPEQVAPLLLGSFLVVGSGEDLVVVRVDEVEAYAGPGEDPGSHAHRGPTRRNATMFGPPGALYVYFTYGMHWCANVVAHAGAGGAVLLRAGQVLAGTELARSRRPAARRDVDLARGPARLTQAVGITGDDDGTDLLHGRSRTRLVQGSAPEELAQGPRVGVSGEGAAIPWRWWDARSTTVSAYRAAQPRRRSATTGRNPAPPAGDGNRRGGAT